MELNITVGEPKNSEEHIPFVLKVEPGAAVVGAAASAGRGGPAGEVEGLRGCGVGGHGLLLLTLVVLRRQNKYVFSIHISEPLLYVICPGPGFPEVTVLTGQPVPKF